MAIRIVEACGIPLTRELAISHASLPAMPGEREVKTARLKFLKDLLDRGLFVGVDWHQGLCAADGIMYRLEGQHSSHMLSELDPAAFPGDQLARITTWNFDTVEHDSATLFNLFNNPRSARTNEDVMGVYRASVPELAQLSRKFLINVANGVHEREDQKWDDGDEQALPPHGPRERGLYFFHPEPVQAALWLSRFQSLKNQGFLGHPTLVSEMLRQWEQNAVAATTFWEFVYRENHPEVDHETRELAETYRDWTARRKQRAPQFRARAAKAWKTFLKGFPTSDLQTA
jgi:hypothetical protein